MMDADRGWWLQAVRREVRMEELCQLVRLAYSAERAAAFAYRGHARSLHGQPASREVARIEAEEWQHREHLARIMARLGITASPWLELKFALIGRVISASCLVLGRFMPMYFAGRLESGNVNEYLRMADLALGTAINDERGCILEMALVEKRHETFFLAEISGHPALPCFERWFRWGAGRSFNDLAADGAVVAAR
jgi:hypothetical protein